MSGANTIGFVVLAHDNLGRVADLIDHLVAADCPVCVHIDKKTGPKVFARFQARMAAHPNVSFARRHRCEWGRFSIVDATLAASETLLADNPGLQNVMLISGSCLPIRPLRQLKNFLKRNEGTDFIESVSVRGNAWVKDGLSAERFSLYFPFSWRRQRRLFDKAVDWQRKLRINRPMPGDLQPYIGSQWWCLTRQTLQAILTHPRRAHYDGYFRWSWIPDESYFQSVAREVSETISSRSLTHSKFDFRGRPFMLYDDHLDQLPLSDAFFVRKVWAGADTLYEKLLDPKRANQPLNQSDPDAFEAIFAKADALRCEGGTGRFHPGRFPLGQSRNAGISDRPYTVFLGLDHFIEDFKTWQADNLQVHPEGRICKRESVNGFDKGTLLPGNLPADPALRKMEPKSYLSNFLRGQTDKHTTMLFNYEDVFSLLNVFLYDEMATIVVVRHGWLGYLASAQISQANLPLNARHFAKLEQKLIRKQAKLQKDQRGAKLVMVDLGDMLDRPDQALRAAIAHLPTRAPRGLTAMPAFADMRKLNNLIRKLRDSGLRLDVTRATRVQKQEVPRQALRSVVNQ